MTKKFQRRKEDFVCEHCNFAVSGSGYTNHCPKCLYSKHVDINPGDRASDCLGMMKPIKVEYSHKEFIIIHECIKCGIRKRNGSDAKDDKELLFELSSKN